MLAPSSLRSQQSKSSLRTYGSRNKRTSSTSTSTDQKLSRQFDWDRLANERKVRIEKARVQAQLRKEAQLEQEAADAELLAELYSDQEQEEEDENRDLHQQSEAYEVVPSTQGSDDEYLESVRPSVQVSSTPFPTTSSSRMTLTTTTTIPSHHLKFAMQREKTFSEQDYEDEDQEDADRDNGQDEVLFRSPSFDLLKKLREIPKPQFPQPRLNPFGYGPLSEPATRHAGVDRASMSSASSTLPSVISSPSLPSSRTADTNELKNPFLILESPKIKKTMDIFQRRRQQLLDLQNRSKSGTGERQTNTTLSTQENANMEVGSSVHRVQQQPLHQNVIDTTASMLEKESSSQEVIRIDSTRDYTTPKQYLRQTTPERSMSKEAYGSGQEDCVDLAIGKRMSSIEITPRRLLAKQRRLAAQDPVSPSRSVRSVQCRTDQSLDGIHLTPPPKPPPFKLFLDHDGQDNAQLEDEYDSLFSRPQHGVRSRPIASISRSMSKNARRTSDKKGNSTSLRRGDWDLPIELPRKAPIPALEQPKKPRIDQRHATIVPFQRRQDSIEKESKDSPDSPLKENWRQSSLAVAQPPSSSPYQPPRLPMLPLNREPLTGPHQQDIDTYDRPMTRPQPTRQVRSLRRPPALLVSHRKKDILRPTVEDLLAICDQHFFEQFREADLSSSPADTNDSQNQSNKFSTSEQEGSKRDILDFESLLPECMVKSLTKIGEASYSEVYTVELPIQRRRQSRQKQQQDLHWPGKQKAMRLHHHSQKNQLKPEDEGEDDEFALFQSPRLNTYVKESLEDDLTPQGMGYTNGYEAGGERTRLVMKIMPFYDTEDSNNNDNNNSSSSNGPLTGPTRVRRGKGRARTESNLLALEDIYREAMVSTKIMHGWKGFIGSFGALVAQGRYPKPLLSAWDRFRKANGTESSRPDIYSKNQLYCIILLPYGGIDLEHCPLANWKQAWSALTQVAASLESKEQAPFWFEHRDLHWGNILVKGTRQDKMLFARRDFDVDTNKRQETSRPIDQQECRSIPTFGIVVQMIDFTLARVQGDKGNLIYMDLEKDQDLFRGQGDYQFEIYRKMRKQISKDWAASCPRTNLFWLHYIADKLLNEKGLEVPRSCPSSREGRMLNLERPRTFFSSSTSHFRHGDGDDNEDDEKVEAWCYSRVLAVLKMNIDRLDPCGQTPSGTVLDLLLADGS